MNTDTLVFIALSGGVDSAVVSHLLKDKYKFKQGISHIVWPASLCCSTECLTSCREQCRNIDIPYQSLDVVEQFSKKVINNFISEYKQGRTPNPCVRCNQFIRFEYMIKRFYEENTAKNFPKEYKIATGHYARIELANGRYLLKKGLDTTKDQSYMLYRLSQEQLSRSLFPLGSMQKNEVREIAAKEHLSSAKKSDSQDACFVDGDYRSFILKYSGEKFPKGNFIDKNGTILGEHSGIPFYARGQRRGLGLNGGPWYVISINPINNTIVVGPKAELQVRSFTISDCVWHYPPAQEYQGTVQVRYHAAEIKCRAIQIDKDSWKISLETDSDQAAPGQSAVLYDGDFVIGGGIITL